MPETHYITASCVIRDQTVYKNGARVFENKGPDLPGFLLSAYQHFGFKYPKFYKMDGLGKLGWLAAELLLDGFDRQELLPEQIGVVLSNASSSLDTDLKYFESAKDIASPSLFVYTLPNIVIGEICIRHQFKGENAFFISPQFDAGFIEQYVNNLVINNILQACICGWVELLGNQHEAVLLLVGKKASDTAIPFTAEHIKTIYQSYHGYTNGRSEKTDH